MARFVRLLLLSFLCVIFGIPRSIHASPTTERVSADSSGTPFTRNSVAPSISSNGHYVAMQIAGAVYADWRVYVKDRQTGVLILASSNSSGVAVAGPAINPSISGDGRYVAFQTPGGLFVKDLQTGALQQANTSSAGVALAGALEEVVRLSTNGRYLAFVRQLSASTKELDVKDLQTGALNVVISGSFGGVGINADGRYVAYSRLNASNEPEIYVKDRQAGTTQFVARGTLPSLSADGLSIAYQDILSDVNVTNVYVKDLPSGTPVQMSLLLDTNGLLKGGLYPVISPNGRYVAFNQVFSVNGGYNRILCVRDRQTSLLHVISASTSGIPVEAFGPSFTADEQQVAFYSQQTGIVPNDTTGYNDVFVDTVANHGSFNVAEFVSHTVPAALKAGDPHTLSLTLKNLGSASWTSADGYRLETDASPWPSWPQTTPLPAGVTVAPGQTYTFTVNVTAPTTEKAYSFKWKLANSTGQVHNSTPPITVYVANRNNAQYISYSGIPYRLVKGGAPVTAKVTMKNTGITTWTSGGGYSLVSYNAPGYLSINKKVGVPAGVSVLPGETYTFTFPVDVPSTLGRYGSQWLMMEEGVGTFGSQSYWYTDVRANYNAEFVSQSVPNPMVAGRLNQVSVTMKNTGDTTWVPGGNGTGYCLTIQPPEMGPWWTRVFVDMEPGASVAPGETYTFNFTVTPLMPFNGNRLAFQWRMVQKAVEFFGEQTDLLDVMIVKSNDLDAQYVNQIVTISMEVGQHSYVYVTMKNTGTTTWTRAGGYYLTSQNPTTNKTWGTNYAALPAGVSVAPGQTYTFPFAVDAPNTPGNYNFQWRMVKAGVAWFGDYTPNMRISVVIRRSNAQFISQTPPPASMTRGQTAIVSVTMKNTGTTTWTYANKFVLTSQSPRGSSTWGPGLRYLPGGTSVPPGGSCTFSFVATAPSTAGTYHFQWQMSQQGVNWFGDASPDVTVTVH